jgi:hypothetical protein
MPTAIVLNAIIPASSPRPFSSGFGKFAIPRTEFHRDRLRSRPRSGTIDYLPGPLTKSAALPDLNATKIGRYTTFRRRRELADQGFLFAKEKKPPISVHSNNVGEIPLVCRSTKARSGRKRTSPRSRKMVADHFVTGVSPTHFISAANATDSPRVATWLTVPSYKRKNREFSECTSKGALLAPAAGGSRAGPRLESAGCWIRRRNVDLVLD